MSSDLPTRRAFTFGILAAAGAVALPGCAGLPADTEPGEPAPTDTDDSDDPPPDPTWATGGAATLAASYADPFDQGDDGCLPVDPLTLGPCHLPPPDRKDISEGVDGLPMRLQIRVVDGACQPVPGVAVDVWHYAPNGRYSGATVPRSCTGGDAAARASQWFRGVQTTGADGIATFDSCFPGWYPSRAVHIHFRIQRDGATAGTSQLFFEPSLIERVFGEHPVYQPFGQPDKPNADDTIFNNADPAAVLLTAARQPDGCLLAWKTVALP